MIGIQLMVLAGACVALSNYFMRKSVDAGGTTKGFLMVQLCVVTLVAILLNPIRMHHYDWSLCMTLFGVAAGCVLGCMMASLGRALETGPPGLTFAALNSSTVMPSIVMALTFGSHYTFYSGLGSLLVVIGLFWAGWSRSSYKPKWLPFVSAAFFLHVLFLVFLSSRALLLNNPGENGLFLSFDMDDAKNQWFMPVAFFVAFLIQVILFTKAEKRKLTRSEWLYGGVGGVANGVGTFFMILATELATHLEHAMIYPIFSIVVIVLCNLWGQLLYRERVNWWANGVCLLGIVVGTVYWGNI